MSYLVWLLDGLYIWHSGCGQVSNYIRISCNYSAVSFVLFPPQLSSSPSLSLESITVVTYVEQAGQCKVPQFHPACPGRKNESKLSFPEGLACSHMCQWWDTPGHSCSSLAWFQLAAELVTGRENALHSPLFRDSVTLPPSGWTCLIIYWGPFFNFTCHCCSVE